MKTTAKPASFPRLLVATEFSPNSAGGSGAIIRQMLKDWPSENLYWWSCLPDRNQHFGQKVAAHSIARIPAKLYPNRRWLRPRSWLLDKFWTPWAARHLRMTLQQFRPEAVWVIAHGWSIPPLARALPRSGIGFHVSIHDFADRGLPEAPAWEVARLRKLASLADQLYASAATRDGICQAMVDDLRARTRCDGHVIRAGLELGDFEFLGSPTELPVCEIKIAYAGTIHVEKTFDLFISALGRIRHRLPLPVTIEFFSDHSYRTRKWFDPAWMHEHGNLPAADLATELKKCSWGFSPMDLWDEDPRYNRFSLPTKLVSYLAAGLPVITLGHPESTVVKVAGAYEIGLCTTTTALDDLSGQLLAALSEPNPRRKYRAEVLRCAEVEFDARRTRAVLFNCFEECAKISKQSV